MNEIPVINEHVTMSERISASHKGNYGRIGIVAGSRGMAGAGELCTKACLRSGAGLVTIACADCLTEVYEIKLTEAMVSPQKDCEGHLSRECIGELISFAASKDCLVFGPGIGRSIDIEDILISILEQYSGMLVIDADGLFALAHCKDRLQNAACQVLITPHIVEMSRLAGGSAEDIKADPVKYASRFALQYGVNVLLKDNVSAIASPDGRVMLNRTGNPGMARGGSGDVLAGVCGALSCRCSDLFDTACEAALVCGIAGDMAAEAYGMDGMLPSDTIMFLGRALKEPVSGHIRETE